MFQIKRFACDDKDASDYTNTAGLNLLRTLCWVIECVSGSLLSYKDRNAVFRESSPIIDSLALFLLPETDSGAEKLANFQTNLHEMPADTFAVAHWCNALKHIAVVYFSQDGAKRVRAWPGKRSEQFFDLLKKVNRVSVLSFKVSVLGSYRVLRRGLYFVVGLFNPGSFSFK